MFWGMDTKPLVVATGALLLAPCLMAYLFGRPMPGFIGPAMKWLGERTYSIYLWQQPFTICHYLPNVLHPFGAMASVFVGGMWFRWFEWPFLTASRRAIEARPPRGNWKLKWLAVGFAVFAALVFVSAWTLRRQYETRLARQIYPETAPQLSIVADAPSGSTPTVLLLGDSRMAQWNLPPLAHWRVVNAGTGGLTTGQLCLSAPKLLDETHPDAVVLEAGINDLKFLGLRPAMAPQITSLAASNLTAVVNECAARRCKIIVLETWPAGQPNLVRRWIWNATIPAAVGSLNARLRLLNAPERGIRVVDLFAETGLKPEAGLYRDALHFKPEVYQQLTPALGKDLDALLSSATK